MGASSQSESNENPITVFEKREDFSFFSEPYQKPAGMFFFQFTIAKQTPLLRKKIGRGWGPFTFVDATLYMSI